MRLSTLSCFYLLLFPLPFCQGQERTALDVQGGSGSGAYGTSDSNPSGLEDIDRLRLEIPMNPTSAENAKSRRAALYRWWRLGWRKGYDLSAFDERAKALLANTDDAAAGQRNIDLGFAQLGEIWANAKLIPEISNAVDNEEQPPTTKTDWPVYFGTAQSQTGYSPDSGPTQGKIAWKFPKGYGWNAKPTIADGKIYASSPGIDVIGFCLEENTGKVLWRGRQYGTHFYGDHGCRWDPVVTNDRVAIRTAYDQASIRILDRQSGEWLLQGESVQGPYSALMAYRQLGRNFILADAETGHTIYKFAAEDYLAGEPQVVDQQIYAASCSGSVYCFDANSNTPVWQIELGKELRSAPTIIGNKLYVGSNDGLLVCLDSSSGQTNWSFQCDERELKSKQFFSGVAKAGDRLYLGASSRFLYCLSSNDGTLIWKHQLGDWIRSKPLVMGGRIYVATLASELVALEDKGKEPHELWATQLGHHGITADLVGTENGILASGRDLIMYSVSPRSGNIQWKRGVVDGVFEEDRFFMADWCGGLLGSPTVVEDVVYTGGPDGFVNAVDANSGREIWRFETGSSISLAPTVAEDKVFFGYLGANTEHYGFDNPGEYFAVDRLTGEPVWKSLDFGRVWVSAAYANGKLFFGNTDGQFFAVNPGTGAKVWTYDTATNTPKEKMPKDTPFKHGYPPGVYSVPTTDEQKVYTGSWSGYYFAFDQETGDLVWRTDTSAHAYGGLPDSAAPTLWKNHLYVQKKGGMVAALNRDTGEVKWEKWGRPGYLQNATVAAYGNSIFTSVVKQVVILPFSSRMIALSDVESGSRKLWEADGVGGLTAPVIANGKLITGSSTSMFLSCLNEADGRLIWRVFIGGEMLENAPAIYGDKVFVHSKNGYINAIK